MPEIKHQFTGGKMNKDVDERLVPNGEYRDAMNIQVSTSEGSDVGTVQNILGNKDMMYYSWFTNVGHKQIGPANFVGENHICVASISDERNDALYWFLYDNGDGSESTIDYILKYENNLVTTVFADVVFKKNTGTTVIANMLGSPLNNPPTITVTSPGHSFGVGEVITSITLPTGQSFTGLTLEINSTSPNEFYITISDDFWVISGLSFSDLSQVVNGVVCDYNIGGNTGQFQPIGSPAVRPSSVLNFSGEPITAVNIIDDMLFWTDGKSEPKKINISRSITGTGSNEFNHPTHTRLLNLPYSGPMKEENVTVIRKSPSKPPTLSMSTSIRESSAYAQTGNTTFSDGNAVLLEPEDQLEIHVAMTEGSFVVGDVICLNPTPVGSTAPSYPPEEYIIKALVEAVDAYGTMTIKIVSISSDTPITTIQYEVAVLEQGMKLFERRFPRFSYRYVYEDGEVSPIGPFSEVAFVPGGFNYHPTEAYNKGMVNNLKTLKLLDFVSDDMPKDVVKVELLLKDEESPVLYVIETIKKNDDKWLAEGSQPGLFGSCDITTDSLVSALPSNQILRPWDNVPKTAISQEITGNRLVYGNYTQGYDVGDSVSFDFNVSARPAVGKEKTRKSIKSLRTYGAGIVYGDKYGRETPVISASTNQTVPKTLSSQSNMLEVNVEQSAPFWADYYKVFIKESSSEYYNLAAGRVYDAADSNIWVAFPSIDRNKVDEDTYIILKKSVGGEAVEEEARYKIVAIENEAPEFIKTTWEPISIPTDRSDISVTGGLSATNVFGGNGTGNTINPPETGKKSFYIDEVFWVGDTNTSLTPPSGTPQGGLGLPDLYDVTWSEKGDSDLYVSFIGDVNGVPTETSKYLITDIAAASNTASTPTRSVYEVNISEPFKSQDDWFSALGGYTNHRPRIYKKTIQNKPEFDGRFFVKIHSDAITLDYLQEEIVTDSEYKVGSSANVYYLADSGNPDITTGTTGPSNSPNFKSITKANWQDNLKFGSNGQRSQWFIDAASYAAQQPISTSDSSLSFNTVGCDTTSTVTFKRIMTTSEKLLYQAALFASGQYNFISGYQNPDYHKYQDYNVGTGLATSSNNKFQKGVYTDSGVEYLTLSYSAIGPDSGTNVKLLNWGVGNDSMINSYTEDEEDFVAKLDQVGSIFRFKGDPQRYKIVSTSKERLYNYKGKVTNNAPGASDPYYRFGDPSSLGRNNQLKEMGQDRNRRVSWTIGYSLEPHPQGITAYNIASNPEFYDTVNSSQIMDADTPGVIQFLESFDTFGENPISKKPAIFETEPKTKSGIDLYYEASGKIPTELKSGNQTAFIPIGSTLVIPPLFTSDFPEPIVVTGWEPALNPGETGDVKTLTISPHITTLQLQHLAANGGAISFSTPLGGVAYANNLIPALPNTTVPPTEFGGLTLQVLPRIGLPWFNCFSFANGVESNRIGDTYNKVYLTNGVKVSTELDEKLEEEHRKYGLIYSGIYNSTSGVNNLNQFIAAEKITKDINPIYGSIQKLHSGWGQGGDLVALCEDRILKILANKDALYNADGNANVTSTNRVLGQAIPYSGEYGISKNPESFASEAYRIYFTDKVRGAVMRLSIDGLTPISNHGMKDWFRDNLKLSNKLVGSYDDKKDEYNITLHKPLLNPITGDLNPSLSAVQAVGVSYDTNQTVTFKEDVKGWVSFKSFTPENAISCANEYYSFKNGKIWLHHAEDVNTNTFYGEGKDYFTSSKLSVVLNDIPGSVKSFKTLNYEGSQSKISQNLDDDQYYNLSPKDGWFVNAITTNKEKGSINEFISKEGKWFNYIRGNDVVTDFDGDILVDENGYSDFDQASFAVQGLGILQQPPQPPAPVSGCTNPYANNYNPLATADDGSCTFDPGVILGCTDPTADNYDATANVDDGSCTYPAIFGCTDPNAYNYDPNATVNDNSCMYCALTVNYTSQNNTVYGGNNGSITAVAGNGTSPITYSWTGSNGYTANTATINSLTAGTYNLTATDANGCTDNLTVNITQPNPPTKANMLLAVDQGATHTVNGLSKYYMKTPAANIGSISNIPIASLAPITDSQGNNAIDGAVFITSGPYSGMQVIRLLGVNYAINSVDASVPSNWGVANVSPNSYIYPNEQIPRYDLGGLGSPGVSVLFNQTAADIANNTMTVSVFYDNYFMSGVETIIEIPIVLKQPIPEPGS